jgi:hypothetical protein
MAIALAFVTDPAANVVAHLVMVRAADRAVMDLVQDLVAPAAMALEDRAVTIVVAMTADLPATTTRRLSALSSPALFSLMTPSSRFSAGR